MKNTHQDIVAALADCWLQWSGSGRPIAADDGIVEWLQDEGWWREIDLMDLRWPVSNYFGVDIPSDEWREFFCGQATSEHEWQRDVAPKINFGRLATLIQQHLANVSFAPVNCSILGVFLVVLALTAGGLDASREGTPPKEIRTFRDLANYVSGQLNS